MELSDFPAAVANLVVAAVGVGMLALPRAVAQGGWWGSAIMLVLGWGVATAATLMQHQSMALPGGRVLRSYQEVGAACFPRYGALMVGVPLLVDVLAVCTLLMILAGSGLHRLVPALSQTVQCTPDLAPTNQIAWHPHSYPALAPLSPCPRSERVLELCRRNRP